MISKGILRVVVLVGVGLPSLATSSAADPIQITSGFVHIQQDLTFRLNGISFSVAGIEQFDSDEIFWKRETQHTYPLTSGQTVNLSTSPFFRRANIVDGSGVLAGSLRGEFVFTAGSASLTCDGHPTFAPCRSDTTTFLFTGFLEAFDSQTQQVLLRHDLTGQGTASASFVSQIPRFGYYEYTFEAAPVPEPASMILLGTGLLGVGFRRWQQRRHPTPRPE